MPVKKITVAFDLDVELFTRILGAANQGVRFEVYGDDPPAALPKPNGSMKALPKPRHTGRHVILAHMKNHPGKAFMPAELRVFMTELGFGKSTIWNVIYNMHRDGLVRKVHGKYRLTDKGMNHG